MFMQQHVGDKQAADLVWSKFVSLLVSCLTSTEEKKEI